MQKQRRVYKFEDKYKYEFKDLKRIHMATSLYKSKIQGMQYF